jgi:hypothetical protein
MCFGSLVCVCNLVGNRLVVSLVTLSFLLLFLEQVALEILLETAAYFGQFQAVFCRELLDGA